MNLFQAIAARIRRYDDTHNFTCDLCAREVFAGEHVCAPCRKSLPWNDGHVCPLCGRRVKEEGLCLECKHKPLAVEKARSALLHEGEAAKLVVRSKRGDKYLYRAEAELILPLLKEFPDADGLVFVPMTAKARKRRGYNQSRLLAEEVSRLSGLPLLDVAEKRRETQAQKSLGRADREKNLEKSFQITDKGVVKGKKLLVVDDTLTTGATVSELAGALKRAGAEKVYALTVTSVENKTPFGERSE